ncbi:MAG: hypothetical protein H7A27_03840 [Spirochaetaceae bacterium]|nr:hypothetical protein [Spirochaetaceae bacterium]
MRAGLSKALAPILIVASFASLFAVSLFALAGMDREYRAMQLDMERSLRAVLRAAPAGRSIRPELEGLFSSVERLERVAVSVDLEEPRTALGRLVELYDAGPTDTDAFLDRFCESYAVLETDLARKRAALADSFYALIAALALGFIVAAAIGADLSARLRLSRYEAAWSRRSLLASLSAEERLRRRIARDLHDEVAQDIAAARMLCERAASASGDAAGRQAPLLSEAVGLMSAAGKRLRRLALDLRPPELERSGLSAAIEALCSRSLGGQVRPAAFKAEPRAARAADSLADEAAIQAFRIVQEALANARKHAPGQDAEVSLRLEGDRGDGTLVVEVTNRLVVAAGDAAGDAAGAAPSERLDESVSSGLGQAIMRERAAIAGGELSAGVEAGSFRVTMRVPSREPGMEDGDA